jgi:hypothetical protein
LAKPFKILSAIINVATPRAIPSIEMVEIKVINFESFLDRVYFFDMKKGRYIYIFLLLIQIQFNYEIMKKKSFK